MTRRAWALALAFLLCFLAAASAAEAQVITATIRGRVADEQGGVLPGATVTARQVETNTSRSVLTTEVGQFFLPSLPAGRYELSISLQGFAPVQRTVVLTVGMDVTLEFTLKVGGLETAITVSGEAPLLETTKTVVGATINKDQVDSLPTVNRDFTSLALLAPGVTSGVGGSGPTLAFNAQRGYQNGIFVDGASNIWQYYGRQASTFSQDWIQEFQVMTNSFSAEFGTASGGILNVITRSGSNQFHGRAYSFFRRKAWDSPPFAGYFTNDDITKPVFLTKDEVPDYTQRRWGGYLGGPVLRNRVFFFAGYEDLMRESTDTLSITDYWKAKGYNAVVPIKTTDHPVMVKGDINLTSSHRLSLRWDRTINKNLNQADYPSYNPVEGRYTFGGPVWNIVGNLTSTLSNTTFNEARAYYMSNMPPIICNASGVGGMASLSKATPGTYAQVRYPNLYIGCPIFTGTEGEQNLVLLDHFSIVKGHHQVKFGGQVQRNTLNDDIANFHDGYWRFGQDLLFDRNDPATYPFRFTGNVGLGAFKIPIWNYNLFVQDTWRMGENVTLNLGVRWDVDRSVTAGNQWVEEKNAKIVAAYGGAPPLQKTNVDYNNVAPRFGVVWTPTADKQTTVHGAVGMFFDQNHGNFNAIYIINTLLSDGLTTINCNVQGNNPFWDGSESGRAACRGWLAQSFPYFPDLSQAPAATQGLDTLDPHLQVPFTTQITGGVAHEFENGFVVSADVVHARGSGLQYIDKQVRMLANGEVEVIDRRFTYISELQNVGFTHYTALQTQGQYRKKNVTLSASYTLSKATSNINSGSIFGGYPTNPFDLNQDKGPDATDIRHNLVINGAYMFPYDIQFAGILVARSAWPYSVSTDLNPTNAYYPPRPEPKNSRRGASEKNVDFRLTKVIKVGPTVRASLFWEMFNAFNTLNYNGINTYLDDPATLGLWNSAADMRRQQLGFRIDF